MSLFVDIPKPKAWPPPKDGKRISELLEYGAKRDPVGDKFHTAFACVFMFYLPTEEFPTTLATWVLFTYSVLRLPSTWRTLTTICNSTIFRMMFAWTAWSLLSIVWSSNQPAGLDHAGALRMVLLPVVLWPVMRHWKYLLFAFLAGVLLQNFVQISEVVGSWFLEGKGWLSGGKVRSTAGLEKHSGKAAMFMGFASLAWLGIIITSRRYKKTATVCLLLAIAGMFTTVSMAVMVGFGSAMIVLIIFTIVKKTITPKQVVIASIALFLSGILAWLTAGNFIVAKTGDAIQGIQDFYDGTVDASNSTQLRLHWWSETLNKIVDEPAIVHVIVGHGLGSVASIDFSKKGSSVAPLAEHIHNTYIQILYEQGVIGLLLFLFFLWKLIQTAKTMSCRFSEYVYPICVSGTIFWSVTTFFENSQSSGRPLAMLILLALFVMYHNIDRGAVKQ